jgi:hypothetical protein
MTKEADLNRTNDVFKRHRIAVKMTLLKAATNFLSISPSKYFDKCSDAIKTKMATFGQKRGISLCPNRSKPAKTNYTFKRLQLTLVEPLIAIEYLNSNVYTSYIKRKIESYVGIPSIQKGN